MFYDTGGEYLEAAGTYAREEVASASMPTAQCAEGMALADQPSHV